MEQFPLCFPLPPSQASPGDVPAWPAATAQPRALPETKTSSRALGAAWDPSSGLFLARVPGSSGSACKINPVAVGAYLAGGKDTLQAGFQKQARAFCNQLCLQQHLHTAPALSSLPSCSEFQVSSEMATHSTEFARLGLHSLLYAQNTPKFKGQEQAASENEV